jgi:hypothetical protein
LDNIGFCFASSIPCKVLSFKFIRRIRCRYASALRRPHACLIYTVKIRQEIAGCWLAGDAGGASGVCRRARLHPYSWSCGVGGRDGKYKREQFVEAAYAALRPRALGPERYRRGGESDAPGICCELVDTRFFRGSPLKKWFFRESTVSGLFFLLGGLGILQNNWAAHWVFCGPVLPWARKLLHFCRAIIRSALEEH